MAINRNGLLDEDGDTSDWLELYNASSNAVSLLAWYLTDDAGEPRKWQFPDVSLASGGYLVIFASGKNRRTSGAQLHTNFQLDGDGEYLALVQSDGTNVVSAFAPSFPRQRPDVSFGRGLDLADHYFATATPGSSNSTDYLFLVADTKFSVDRGFYSAPFTVAITTKTTNAVIRYTINGSAPSTTNGTTYTGPITISNTTTLRAAAFKNGSLPSVMDTQTYLFLSDVVRQDYQASLAAGFPTNWGGAPPDYGFDPDVVGPNGTDHYGGKYTLSLSNDLASIPSLSLVLNVDDMFGPDGIYVKTSEYGDAYERPASAELIYPTGQAGFHVNAGLRLEGGFFRSDFATKKHSFRLLFNEQHGPTKLRFPLFGRDALDEFDTLTLRAGSNDSWQWAFATSNALYIRDSFACQTLLEMGGVASHDLFVHLYINGMYWGLYDVMERPDASFAAAHYGGDKDQWDALHDGAVSNGSDGAWTNMLALCQQGLASDTDYQRIQGNNPDGTRNPAYENYLDVSSLIDYMILNIYCGTGDWPARNYWVARAQTNSTGFKFFPWDAEEVAGFFITNVNFSVVDASDVVAIPYAAARSNAEFRLEFADHAHNQFFNGGALYVDPAHPQWDSAHPERNRPAARFVGLAQQIDRAIVPESARWGDQHTAVPYTRDEHWAAARDRVLSSWLPQRSAVVLNQLRAGGLYPNLAAPAFNQHGGEVPAGFQLTMAAPAGAIYYTLDGLDPRKKTNAPAYSTAITLTNSVTVKARALSNNVWSALNEALFIVARPRLAITEIQYHPAEATPAERAGGVTNAEDFEFIELKNFGTQFIDLTGARFTNGIQFNFTGATISNLSPGQVIVLVKNRAAFELRYGAGLPIAGEYAGNLSNGGETVTLVNAAGMVLVSVSYDDAPPWPLAADGSGSSLELIDVQGDYNSPTNWQASAQAGGTPGVFGLVLRIESAAVEGGLFKLRFSAKAGHGYTVYYRGNLSSGPWDVLVQLAPSGLDTLAVITDSLPATNRQRFYQVSTP